MNRRSFTTSLFAAISALAHRAAADEPAADEPLAAGGGGGRPNLTMPTLGGKQF